MSKRRLFTLKSEDETHDLGKVYSDDEATLRTFGASYMRDSKTSGSLALCNPNGTFVATFDVWIGDWKEAAET